nr:unnamed protein product [Callosobruchus chinensis]
MKSREGQSDSSVTRP